MISSTKSLSLLYTLTSCGKEQHLSEGSPFYFQCNSSIVTYLFSFPWDLSLQFNILFVSFLVLCDLVLFNIDATFDKQLYVQL